jgi:hypothetical protein
MGLAAAVVIPSIFLSISESQERLSWMTSLVDLKTILFFGLSLIAS